MVHGQAETREQPFPDCHLVMNRAQRCEMHNLSCSGGWEGPRVESGGHFGQVDSARNFKEFSTLAWVLSMTLKSFHGATRGARG